MRRRYVQAAIRRNGLHAVRGWCLNQLRLCPGIQMDKSGLEYEGSSWFSWTIRPYAMKEVLAASKIYAFITLESAPLDFVLDYATRTNSTAIVHVRSLENWLASSIKLVKDRDGRIDVGMHEYCILAWRAYERLLRRGGRILPRVVAFRYDRWVVDAVYRKRTARQLGVDCDGSPYQRVHGVEHSSFDGDRYDGAAERMDVLNRADLMRSDPDFNLLMLFAKEHRNG